MHSPLFHADTYPLFTESKKIFCENVYNPNWMCKIKFMSAKCYNQVISYLLIPWCTVNFRLVGSCALGRFCDKTF